MKQLYEKDGTYDIDSQYKLVLGIDDYNAMMSQVSLSVASAKAFADNEKRGNQTENMP